MPDLTREELSELWERNGNKDRPAFVREHRDALHAHTDTTDPIPEGSLSEVRLWLNRYKSTVTRQLNDDTAGTDPHDDADDGETPTTDAAEGEA